MKNSIEKHENFEVFRQFLIEKTCEDNVRISLNQESCEYKLWEINVLPEGKLPILLSKLEVVQGF